MTPSSHYPLLDKIDSPADLRALPEACLEQVAAEVRAFLLASVSRSGGHFAAGLGSVELTVALHYLYNTPDDRIVWDVGHQAYPHKILTGRKERLHTIRQWQGLAPFPKREESEYDTFSVGHSSTSISAALGMAIAAKLTGSNRRAVAVIGDGAMTAGVAFEALNHAGDLNTDLLVILNDNNMSISPNVGALSNRFAQILSGKLYTTVREGSKKVLSQMPSVWELARRAEEHVKGLIVPGTLFEEFGFNYIGPIDGHDLDALVHTLRNVQQLRGPQLLHVITKKGKGYAPAEADPVKYHGVSPFDPEQGIVSSGKKGAPNYSDIFGAWVCDMAARDRRLVAITPAMREGSGLVRFEREYPNRYFDVAIAEQHSVNVAAGMACDGLKPVVAIYSTFLQRGYDQVIHDVANQNLPVLFALDRAGLVGADGPTHNGSYDISFLRCLPNMTVMTPADENECRQMLYTGFTLDSPAAVRYPRGTGPGATVETEMTALPIGKADVRRRGRRGAILAFGVMLAPALEVGERLDLTVVNMRFVKPLDESLVLELARGHELLVTIEENVIAGGAGSAVNECLASHGVVANIANYGLPDRLIQHGSREEMLVDAGLDAASFERFVRERLAALEAKDAPAARRA
ncbi:MAG: 1-deoxy-D-xylulose-5-phosphate synthase [Gammaproteobacteria bacterium]|nr:1-deoxy-D-xylulose-5-phosphate synthase [Gammaproteobacteria bacterium]